MKRGTKVLWLLFFTLIILFILPTISGIDVVGDVTGKVSAQSTNVSIQVITNLPILTLISPINGTYLTNTSLLLNYTQTGANLVWYNIDNGTNTTITSYIYFNTSQGNHTLYLYANNSYGTTSKNVTFTVTLEENVVLSTGNQEVVLPEITSPLNISIPSEITNPKINMENLIISNETTKYVTINAMLKIDATTSIGNIILNIPSGINISGLTGWTGIINLPTILSEPTVSPTPTTGYTAAVSAVIDVGSINVTLTFNKAVRLLLPSQAGKLAGYSNSGVFTKINTTCTDDTQSTNDLLSAGGDCKINVGSDMAIWTKHFTEFLTYTETASPSGTPSSSGGGGGVTTPTTPIEKISLDKENIKISLKQGETKIEKITIKNLDTKKLILKIEEIGLTDFVRIENKTIEIEAGKTKKVLFDFIARESTIPDLYVGKLIIKGDSIEKEVLIVVEVESKKSLFDIKLEIPKKFSTIKPREDLMAKIELYNLGGQKKVDVEITYIIKDEQNKIIISQSESVAVETRANLVKTFTIPENLNYGKYILYVQVNYNGEIVSASELFNVGEYTIITGNTLLIFILIIGLIITFYEVIKLRRYVKGKVKIDENIFIQHGLLKRRGE